MHYQVFERGWLSSNNILFFDSDGATIVDTGYCTHAQQTLALVEHALHTERRVRTPDYTLKRIVNTHLHSDHCGGNAALMAAYPGLDVQLPCGQAPAVARWDESELSYRDTGQQCPCFTYSSTLKPGDHIALGGDTWRVYAAPGHDPHSLILFEPNSRTLISADALWENGCGVIFPELRGEPGFEEALATLDLIESLTPETVIPGHGAPFTNAPAAIQRARDRLLYLQADPKRNASHGLRVLLKFYLMQAGQVQETQALSWLQQLGYFQVIRRLYFHDQSEDVLAKEVLERLVAANAVKRMEGLLLDK
jgi:glyoxylase-like metal-dependent hydrolase (beta-lactamase superfamily II)